MVSQRKGHLIRVWRMNQSLHLYKAGEGSLLHSENAAVPRGWDNGGK